MKKLIRLAPLLLVATPIATLSCTRSVVENEDVIVLREALLDRREMQTSADNKPIDPINIRRVTIGSVPTELIISYDVIKSTSLAMLNYFLPKEQGVNKNIINENARDTKYKTQMVKVSLVELYEKEIIEVIQEQLIKNDKIHNPNNSSLKSVKLAVDTIPLADIEETPETDESEWTVDISISLVFKINVVNNNDSGLVLVINGDDSILSSDHIFNINAVKTELEKYPTSNDEDTPNYDIRWARQLNLEIIKAIRSFPTR